MILDHRYWGKLRISYTSTDQTLTLEALHIATVPRSRIDDFQSFLTESRNTFIVVDSDGTLHTKLSFHSSFGDMLSDIEFRNKYTLFENKMELLYPTAVSDDSIAYPLADSYACKCGSSQTAIRLSNDPWPGEECFSLFLNYCNNCGGYQLVYEDFREYTVPRRRIYCIPVSGPGEAICLKEMYGMSELIQHVSEYTLFTNDI